LNAPITALSHSDTIPNPSAGTVPVGNDVGKVVGNLLGILVGADEAPAFGESVDAYDGEFDALPLGSDVGKVVGNLLGTLVGADDPPAFGASVDAYDGEFDTLPLGSDVGKVVGNLLGILVGIDEGCEVGDPLTDELQSYTVSGNDISPSTIKLPSFPFIKHTLYSPNVEPNTPPLNTNDR